MLLPLLLWCHEISGGDVGGRIRIIKEKDACLDLSCAV